MDTTGLHLRCDRCAQPLTEPGGLLFGAPDATWQVRKWHLCTVCTDTAVALLGLPRPVPTAAGGTAGDRGDARGGAERS